MSNIQTRYEVKTFTRDGEEDHHFATLQEAWDFLIVAFKNPKSTQSPALADLANGVQVSI